jgi:hypothetical protein
MVRNLTTCEKTGTIAVSKISSVPVIITGSYKGGFMCQVVHNGDKVQLPFKNVDKFYVSD